MIIRQGDTVATTQLDGKLLHSSHHILPTVRLYLMGVLQRDCHTQNRAPTGIDAESSFGNGIDLKAHWLQISCESVLLPFPVEYIVSQHTTPEGIEM